MQKKEYVCFCSLNRHAQFSSTGRFRSNCDVCGSLMNLTRIMSVEEAMAAGMLAQEGKEQPMAIQPLTKPQGGTDDQIPQPNPVDCDAAGKTATLPGQSFTPASAPVNVADPVPRPVAVRAPFSPAPAPVQAAPESSVLTPSFGAVKPPQQIQPVQEAAQGAMRFDYFGEKIPIPPEGGWIGRSELGKAYFEGNLLISRKHLRVKPLESGLLEVGPDNSLNGVFIDTGNGRQPLDKGTVLKVASGSIIWIYNIPLKLENG